MINYINQLGGIEAIKAAFSFLTRIPMGHKPPSSESLRWASAHFPLVGVCIGLLMTLCFWTFLGCGPWAATAIALALSIWITGAFHEDGLADSADALGGGLSENKIFEILKDSRVGTFGAIALTISYVVRWSLLSSLEHMAPVGFILSQSIARIPPVWMMASIPYVTPSRTRSKPLLQADFPQLKAATLFGLVLIAIFVVTGLVHIATALRLLILLIISTLWAARIFIKRTGGITGDFLGATEQLSEIVVLIVLAIAT